MIPLTEIGILMFAVLLLSTNTYTGGPPIVVHFASSYRSATVHPVICGKSSSLFWSRLILRKPMGPYILML
jgi:hypothetical protein